METTTAKQRRLEKTKKAKKRYSLAREHQSEEFIKLRNYTFNALINLNKKKFNCGSLQVKLLS